MEHIGVKHVHIDRVFGQTYHIYADHELTSLEQAEAILLFLQYKSKTTPESDVIVIDARTVFGIPANARAEPGP